MNKTGGTTAGDSEDAQKIRLAEQRVNRKGKVKHSAVLRSHLHSQYLKQPVFSFGMPVSKMDILRQSLQKQNLITIQTTPLKIPWTTPLTIPSDSRMLKSTGTCTDTCMGCGEQGHWRKDCSKVQQQIKTD